MVNNQIEVILFDLGGVLVELTGVPVMLGWSADDMSPEMLWEKWLTSPVVRDFESGRIHHEYFAERLIEEMGLDVKPDVFLEKFISWPKGLFPGTKELIKRISPEFTLAVLSNSNSLHWPRMMDETGLSVIFDHFFASHLMGKLKPDLEAFDHVLEELVCEPEQVLYVDDNKLNVDAARSLGIQAVETKGIEEVEQALEDYGII